MSTCRRHESMVKMQLSMRLIGEGNNDQGYYSVDDAADSGTGEKTVMGEDTYDEISANILVVVDGQ